MKLDTIQNIEVVCTHGPLPTVFFEDAGFRYHFRIDPTTMALVADTKLFKRDPNATSGSARQTRRLDPEIARNRAMIMHVIKQVQAEGLIAKATAAYEDREEAKAQARDIAKADEMRDLFMDFLDQEEAMGLPQASAIRALAEELTKGSWLTLREALKVDR